MFANVVVVLAVLAVASAANIHDRTYYEAKFFDWVAKFGIKAQSGEHFVHMLQNFANNDDIIEDHNSRQNSYRLAHNHLSHMSLDEFKAYYKLGLARPEKDTSSSGLLHEAPTDLSALASSVDWSVTGGVTGVKDQGQCGSCWSFSTTGALESAYYNKYNSLLSFSEQNFVDCDILRNGGRDHGCNGGLMDNAFTWAKKNGGICTEDAYPYVSGTTKTSGTCQTTCSKVAAAAPQSYTDVTVNSDAALMSALNKQAVSVAIEADQSAFQLYSSGVLTAACGTTLDHGVLAVGYGTWTDGTDYYKVKNSWGTSWGMNGYILLQRGVSQAAGQCGILASASYPNL